jgi:proteasome lid subunit RPN8/RPN11
MAENTMNRIVVVPPALIDPTIASLQDAGRRDVEGVVLWLAKPHEQTLAVTEIYVPIHEAAEDYFHIPPKSIHELMQVLRTKRLMVAAQIHSHPAEAFHSAADSKWAIVRHSGALSIVVPNFAKDVTVANFVERAATFALSSAGKWQETPRDHLGEVLKVMP